MAVSHVKTDTIADWTGTVTVGNSAGATQTIAATDLVRPVDWNSAHNQYYTLSGNTNNASTASGTNVVFAGSGGVTLGGSTDSIIVSSPMLSSYEPYPFYAAISQTVGAGSQTSSPVTVVPFEVVQPVSAGAIAMAMSLSFATVGTSSGQQTAGVRVGIYTRPTNTNSSRIDSWWSTSFSWGVTGNNSTYTMSHPTTTNFAGYTYGTSSSAGSSISSLYHNQRMVHFPVSSVLTAGQYWFAAMATNSTSSNSVGIRVSWIGMALGGIMDQLAPFGSNSSAYTTGSAFEGGRFWPGLGSWSSAGSVTALPASMAFASISQGVQFRPALRFWSTA